MSSIVSFCWGLSLNLISTLYQAQKLKLVEVHTPIPSEPFMPNAQLGPIVMFYAICYICTIQKARKTPTEECYLLQSCSLKACIFTKSSTPPWVFFTIFKLYKWYQITQTINSEFAINTWELKNSWQQLFWETSDRW